jgi:hypothetical protein
MVSYLRERGGQAEAMQSRTGQDRTGQYVVDNFRVAKPGGPFRKSEVSKLRQFFKSCALIWALELVDQVRVKGRIS